MKKILILLLILTGCTLKLDSTFTGYVVYKSYTPIYIGSDNRPESITYSGTNLIILPNVAAKAASHRRRFRQPFPSEFLIWVANKDRIKIFNVDSTYFNSVKCGQKITIR